MKVIILWTISLDFYGKAYVYFTLIQTLVIYYFKTKHCEYHQGEYINLLSPNLTKWSNIHKQFVGKSRQIVLSVSDHFVGLALKGLHKVYSNIYVSSKTEAGK